MSALGVLVVFMEEYAIKFFVEPRMKPTGYFDWYSKSHEALLDGKYSTHMLDIVTDKEQRIGLISVAAVKQFWAGVVLRRLELRVNGTQTELITHFLYFDM